MGEVLSICVLPPSLSSFTRAQHGFPFLSHVLSLLPHHLTAVSRMFTLWGDLAPEEERDGRSIPYRDKMENELMETENRIEFMAPDCWGCLQVIGISGSGNKYPFAGWGGRLWSSWHKKGVPWVWYIPAAHHTVYPFNWKIKTLGVEHWKLPVSLLPMGGVD